MIVTSEKFKLNAIDFKKIAWSFFYGFLVILAMGLLDYLTRFGLPQNMILLAPFLPTIINTLKKFIGESTYVV